MEETCLSMGAPGLKEETCLSVGAPGLMPVGGGGAHGEGSGECDRRLILSVFCLFS